MSRKNKERKAKEQARLATMALRRKRLILITSTSLIALALLIGGGLAIARAIRLSKVYAQTQPMAVELTKLSQAAVDYLTPEYPALITTEDPRTDLDILLAPYLNEEQRTQLFSADPYLLFTDQRYFGSPYPIPPGTNLQALLTSLPRESDWQALVVAGDNDQDLLAFILYISNALLSEVDFNLIRRFLAQAPLDDEAVTLPAQLDPVLTYIQQLVTRGILAFNWTNWDHLSLKNAVQQGNAGMIFSSRSLIKSMDNQERFYLTPQLPPPGQGKLRFSLITNGLTLQPGPGPRRDAAPDLLQDLKSYQFQEFIEKSTTMSPLSTGATVLNRIHRDVVSWLNLAQELIPPLSQNLLPVLSEIRRQLR